MNTPEILPHDEVAERHVLACCLLDEGATLDRCNVEGITRRSFYIPRYAEIYDTLQSMRAAGIPITTGFLSSELTKRGLFNEIGGETEIAGICDKIPTTAHAGKNIDYLRGHELQRTLIRELALGLERAKAFRGTREELHELAATLPNTVAALSEPARRKELSFDELLRYDTTKDPDCLLGNRYLGRGGGLVVAAPSGLGKSVLSQQAGILFSCGKALFSLQPKAPLRVLVVQAEDDTGDVAEAVQGVEYNYALTAADRALVGKNYRTLHWNDVAGASFIARLRAEYAKRPFDLVVINPLFSFAGCDPIEAAEISHFLRTLLNPLLSQTRSAAIVIHHTGKPPRDAKDERGEDTAAYDMFGSSEITNWARAVISMQLVRGTGGKVCKMMFGKRGLRAGLIGNDGQPTKTITIEHAPKGLCWVASDWKPDTAPNGQYKQKFDLEKARGIYNPEIPWPKNEPVIAKALGCSERTVRNWRHRLETVSAE